jgi:hypothetical protein
MYGYGEKGERTGTGKKESAVHPWRAGGIVGWSVHLLFKGQPSLVLVLLLLLPAGTPQLLPFLGRGCCPVVRRNVILR